MELYQAGILHTVVNGHGHKSLSDANKKTNINTGIQKKRNPTEMRPARVERDNDRLSRGGGGGWPRVCFS